MVQPVVQPMVQPVVQPKEQPFVQPKLRAPTSSRPFLASMCVTISELVAVRLRSPVVAYDAAAAGELNELACSMAGVVPNDVWPKRARSPTARMVVIAVFIRQ